MIQELPHSPESERAVLGALLIDAGGDITPRIMSVLTPESFHIVRHRRIYKAILELRQLDTGIDFETVAHRLNGKNGTAIYAELSEMINTVPTAFHGVDYARQVADLEVRRRMLQAASTVAQNAYNTDGDLDLQLSEAIGAVSSIHRNGNGTGKTAQVMATDMLEQIEDWHRHPLKVGQVRGISTGFMPLDMAIGGLTRGHLLILAARPGMGKSALSFQIGKNIARAGGRVALFSLEMSREDVMMRWACGEAMVDREFLLRGEVTSDEYAHLTTALGTLGDLDIYTNDGTGQTSSEITADVARLTARAPLDLVVIDHLSLLGDRIGRGENETLRLGRMSWACKRIAKDYSVPVMLVTQLNRGVEQRRDKRPLLSDLRQSGQIEENADTVVMMYREGYYDSDCATPNITELLPRKVRHGDPGKVIELYFVGKHVTFRLVDRLREA